MEAYVVQAPPVHENSINYFSAELGFYRLGYFVERYKLSDLGGFQITDETPVFGGIESLLLVRPNYQGLPYYPEELRQDLHREIHRRKIVDVNQGDFFKPIESEHKLFSPRIKDLTFECDLLLSRISSGAEVIVSEPVRFVSEFRVYVRGGEILNICYYKGNPCVLPNVSRVESMVAKVSGYAVAFAIDVGVLESGVTALVEMNDFCCLGNYGLKAVDYAKCIAERWSEMWMIYSKV